MLFIAVTNGYIAFHTNHTTLNIYELLDTETNPLLTGEETNFVTHCIIGLWREGIQLRPEMDN